jgi:hypothetical protein
MSPAAVLEVQSLDLHIAVLARTGELAWARASAEDQLLSEAKTFTAAVMYKRLVS